MKYFYAFLFAILLFPFLASAQSNYVPGYVVTIKGDTLKGFIDNQEWDSNPIYINFKKDKTLQASQRLTPDDINFFNVDNIEAYQKYSGRISQDRIDADHINYGKDTSFKVASVFLKILEKDDKVTLLSYVDGQRPHFYIQEKSANVPTELIYSIYIVEDPKTGNVKTIAENTFKQQLYAIAQKYDMLTDRLQVDIEHSDYKMSDILDIVSKINNTTIKKTHASGPLFFVGASLNINQNSPSSTSNYYTAGGRAYTSYLPAVSFGVDIFTNPNTQRSFFHIEASVAQSQYRYTYVNKVYPFVPSKASFNETNFGISPQIVLNIYNAKNLKFFAGIGVTISTFISSNVFYGPLQASQKSPGTFDNQFVFNEFNSGFLLKAGLKFGKRWAVVGTYFSNVATTNAGYFSLTSNCKQIGINYFFK